MYIQKKKLRDTQNKNDVKYMSTYWREDKIQGFYNTFELRSEGDDREYSIQSSKKHILFKCTLNILHYRMHARHKANLDKFIKIEIISSIFFDHKHIILLKVLL